MSEWTTILSVVVGSTAYGLAGPDSDVDRLAFAAAPTVEYHGLKPPMGKHASRVTNAPNMAVHDLWRLCWQAQELHVTGTLTLRLANPEICREFAERIVNDPGRGLEVAQAMLAATALVLDSTPSALPDFPDEAAAESFLRRVRANFYQPPED